MAARRHAVYSVVLALVLISLVALLLRLIGLGSKDLWQDEGTSIYYAQLPLHTLYWSLCDPHPPGYYLALRVALALGRSEWWIRLPSALGGVLAVLLTYVQARVVLHPLPNATPRRVTHAALLAAGLVAVSPLHVWYSQEARPYALLSALALAMTASGTWWWLRPRLARALVYLLASWLALSLEYGALAAWALLNLLLLRGWPWGNQAHRSDRMSRKTRNWLMLQGLVIAPFAIWWLRSAQGAALARPSYHAVFLAVQASAAGLGLTPERGQWVVGGALALAVAAGLIGALVVRRSPVVRSWLGSPWVGVLLAALLLLLAVWGMAPRLYTVKRHLVVLLPFVAIAAAWALTSPAVKRPHLARGITAGLLLVCLVLSLATVLLVPKSAWREAVHTLASEAQPGDAIWVDEMSAPVFGYYWQDRLPWQPLLAGELEALNSTPAAERVWVVGDVSPYRDIMAMLPTQFAATRVVTEQFDLPGLVLRAYDTGVPAESVPAPAEALLWGLTLPSPLEIDCH
ncbi:MAG: hypothetical protein R2844_23490 [Caldilineales bacterium]